MLPLALLLIQFVCRVAFDDFYVSYIRSELGLVQNMTVVALIVAIVNAGVLFARRREVNNRLFGPFALVMCLGCIYFAGEEASWGQHWFGFETPESIREGNDQGEFNLHNTSGALGGLVDQLPRNLLTLAALIGGLVLPLTRSGRKRVPKFDQGTIAGWVFPTFVCAPSALLALIVSLPEKIIEAREKEVPHWLDIAPGESKELYLAMFLMIYLLAMRRYLTREIQARNSSPS